MQMVLGKEWVLAESEKIAKIETNSEINIVHLSIEG